MESAHNFNTFWVLSQATNLAQDTDLLLDFTIISNYFFAISFVITIGFALKHNLKVKALSRLDMLDDYDHSTLWSVIQSFRPLLICFVIFILVFQNFIDQKYDPLHELEISASLHQDSWVFSYDDRGPDSTQLFIPIDRTVKITIYDHQPSDKSRTLPRLDWNMSLDQSSMTQATIWLNTQVPGEHIVRCDGNCSNLPNVLDQVRVLSNEVFAQKRHEASSAVHQRRSLQDWGRELYEEHNCETCHGLEEGTDLVGPSLWGVYKRKGMTEGGQAYVADEDYLRESLIEPHAVVVKGYPRSMPSFKEDLTGDKLEAIIAFMKTLR